jgi:hypothetical protein
VTVTGTATVTQGAAGANAWPVSAAALPLPSGAATSALQGGGLPAALAANGGLKVEGVAGGVAVPISSAAQLPAALGQAAMANSLPVAIASNQSAVSVDVSDRIGRLAGRMTHYDVLANGSLGALNATVELACAGLGTVGIGISGTWVGTIVAEITVGDGVWSVVPLVDNLLGSAAVSTTVNGNFLVGIAGALTLRIRMSLYTSGTATVYLEGTSAPAGTFLSRSIPTGINTIGAVTLANGQPVALGATTDAVASIVDDETATARTGIGLWKAIKNLAIDLKSLLNGGLPAALAAGGGLKVEGVAGGVAQPVSVASLPLPSGAATSAAQLPDSHNVTVDNETGAAAVNIQDGGNTITVDGTVAVTAAALPLPSGAATSALQGGGLPAALGQGTMATSLPVVMASDQSAVPVVDDYTPTEVADVTADDSDKTFTVTAAKVWQVQTIHVSLTSTATAGNRQMTVDYTDDANNVLARVRAGATQAASLTYSYTFGIGLDKDVAPIGLHLTAPLPQMSLLAGWKIRVYDSAAIAAAADDLTVEIVVAERAA